MLFKKRAFALIWIVLSAVLCCGLFAQYEKNIILSNTTQSPIEQAPIDKNKLSLFLLFTSLLSLSMGVFFFAYSDEIGTYIGNYQRTKEI